MCKIRSKGNDNKTVNTYSIIETKHHRFKIEFSKMMRNPVLLIMDNHFTHTTLKAFNFCKGNGIVVVFVPPHTSHWLQPLDIIFYSPLKSSYNQECSTCMKLGGYEIISHSIVATLLQNCTFVLLQPRKP